MLRYNIENLDPVDLATIIGVLDADADGRHIAAVRIAKEHLRDLLARAPPAPTSPPRPARSATSSPAFYIWRAGNDGVPERRPSPKTRSNRQQPVIDAVLHRLLQRESRGA